MKFLVTGCYGFIGSKMCSFLLNRGENVVGVDIINKNEIKHDKFLFLPFESIIKGDPLLTDIDVIYHFAWCGVSSQFKNDLSKQISNLTIAYNILELARVAKVSRIVIPGSISEFSRSHSPVKGIEKSTPSDLYAATKTAVRIISEKFCRINNISLNWALITSVYGGQRNDDNLLTYTICNLLKNEKVTTTKLEQLWDYIFIDDLVFALWLIGTKGSKNAVYPIGTGRIEPLSYYVRFIAKTLGKENLLEIGKIQYKNKYVDNSIVDVSKLRKLGFYCKNSFEDNILSVIDYYRKVISIDK